MINLKNVWLVHFLSIDSTIKYIIEVYFYEKCTNIPISNCIWNIYFQEYVLL